MLAYLPQLLEEKENQLNKLVLLRERIDEKLEATFVSIAYYDYVSTEINVIRTKLKSAFDPLKKHLRILEEEVKESKSLLEKKTAKELEYFKSVNNIESFKELEPVFNIRLKEQETVINVCEELCDFTTDQGLIDSNLDGYKLEIGDKRDLEKIFF